MAVFILRKRADYSLSNGTNLKSLRITDFFSFFSHDFFFFLRFDFFFFESAEIHLTLAVLLRIFGHAGNNVSNPTESSTGQKPMSLNFEL